MLRTGVDMPLSRLFRLTHWVLVVLVLTLVAHAGRDEWDAYVRSAQGLVALEQLKRTLSVAEMASRERGPMNALLGSQRSDEVARLKALQDARLRTDLAFETALSLDSGQASGALAHPRGYQAGRSVAQELLSAREALSRARARVDQLAALPSADRDTESMRSVVAQMVAVVDGLAVPIDWLTHHAVVAHPELADAIRGARMAAELREHAGRLGSLFTPALHQARPFNASEYSAIEQERGRIDQLHQLLDMRLRAVPEWSAVRAAETEVRARYLGVAGRQVDSVIEAGRTDGRYGQDPAAFAARYVPEMAPILALRDALMQQAGDEARRGHASARNALLLLGTATLGLVLTLLASIWMVQRRVIRPLALTTATIAALAEGDLTQDVPEAVANDEVAAVLGAVRALKQHQVERRALETERDQLIAQLVEHSSTDFLTGLPNRRAFFEAAERALAQSLRHDHAVAVVLLDLDHFKAVNDTHGHGVGDQTLVEVGLAIRQTLRQGDLVARYGGEEFIVLLSGVDAEAAMQFAERLRGVIAALVIRTEVGGAVGVTASMGVATSGDWGPELAGLLSHADAALYAAKASGRDRVMLADLDRRFLERSG